jgi:hypothetical protein
LAEFGEQEAVRREPAGGLEPHEGALCEGGRRRWSGQVSQSGAYCCGLQAKAAQPELATLIRHRWRRLALVG